MGGTRGEQRAMTSTSSMQFVLTALSIHSENGKIILMDNFMCDGTLIVTGVFLCGIARVFYFNYAFSQRDVTRRFTCERVIRF